MLDIHIATTQSELESVYRLRYQVYVEELGATMEHANHQQKALSDEWDKTADIIGAWQNDELVGCVRLNYSHNTDLSEYEVHYHPLVKETVLRKNTSSISISSKWVVAQAFRRSILSARILQGCRIAPAGRTLRCDSRMIEGSYGYQEGSLLGVANTMFVGTLINTAYDRVTGKISGFDTASFNGQFAPRSLQGTYKLNQDCTGTGNYGDSLGNTVNYVFMVVDDGDHIYLQGTDPGVNIFGIAKRMR